MEKLGNDILLEVGLVNNGEFYAMQQSRISVLAKHWTSGFLIEGVVVVLQKVCHKACIVFALNQFMPGFNALFAVVRSHSKTKG